MLYYYLAEREQKLYKSTKILSFLSTDRATGVHTKREMNPGRMMTHIMEKMRL